MRSSPRSMRGTSGVPAEPSLRPAIADATAEAEEDFFSMANLAPEDTGLPMVVWVSQRGGARHAPRVKVSLVHGRRMRPERTTSVSIVHAVEVVAGPPLPHDDLELVRDWIARNRAVLLDYWDEVISTRELLERLVKV